jgi:hypothetical protein
MFEYIENRNYLCFGTSFDPSKNICMVGILLLAAITISLSEVSIPRILNPKLLVASRISPVPDPASTQRSPF